MISLSFEEKKEIGYQYVRELLEPVSPYGIKRLREEGFYGPDRQEQLDRELDNVALLKRALEKDRTSVMDLRQRMSGLKELSGTFSHCTEGMVLTEVELFELSSFCRRINELLPFTRSLKDFGSPDDLLLEDMGEPLRILQPEGKDSPGFFIEDSRTPALLEARTLKRRLERQLRMTKDSDLMRQRQEAAAAEEKALAEIFADISDGLCPYMPLFMKNAETIGRLDAALAKAALAERFGCVRPQIGGNELFLRDAVHPQAAAALEAEKRSFTPITIRMPKGVTVLTGANMGGKSVALKTAALNAALALSGCFPFCSEAKVPLFDRIDLISRDLSDIEIGLSSFGAEILRFNESAEHIPAEGLSLIVMDEFARGTNAGEGAAIVKASVKYLSGKNALTLLATHYDGAAEFAVKHYQVKGLGSDGDGQRADQLSEGKPHHGGQDALRRIGNAMDYGLIEVQPGTECPRDAVRICRMLGLPKEILDELELNE